MSDHEPETRTLSSEEAEIVRRHLQEVQRKAFLIVIRGPHEGRMYRLEKAETHIGRSYGCEVRIEDGGVSRRHAAIERQGTDFVVVDRGSSNGTFVNGRKIDRETLRDGAQIQLAGVVLKFTFQDPIEEDFQRRIYNSATRDGLTGAFNKEFFHDHLDKSAAHALRHGSALSLVLFDLDHFKKLNDRYGHPAGDYVLRQTIEVVRGTLRGEEVLARCGGEEFGLILEQTDLDSAQVAGERLREALARHEFVWNATPLRVTVSVGVAGLGRGVSNGGQLLEAADRNLYRAKAAGRNCTVGGDAPPEVSD
jgi:diguanylate cyclase (GGDEF)-like protein